jgi:uncharacterized Zn finger protein
MKKIDRCPHCSGCAKIRKNGNAYVVRCTDCGASTKPVYRNGGVSPAVVQNFTITLWNLRAELWEW